MKISLQRRCSGYTLLLVMLFAGSALVVLAGVLGWSTTKAKLAIRHNHYYNVLAVNEAAHNKVLSRISQDFRQFGSPQVDANLATYPSLIPSAQDNDWLEKFEIFDLNGNPDRISVSKLSDWNYTTLDSGYLNLNAQAASVRIGSQVQETFSEQTLALGLSQEVVLASIPVFQFAIFYGQDLEIHPSSSLSLAGRVHSNGNLYSQANSLHFQSPVSASQNIVHGKHPSDPVERSAGTIVYSSDRIEGARAINLPLGTTNHSQIAHAILEVPPPAEPIDSVLGSQRYYNKAEMVVRVYDSELSVTSGAYNNFSTPIDWAQSQNIVDTNLTFFNKRENKTVQLTQIDFAKIRAHYDDLTVHLGRPLKTLYVADLRTQTSTTQSGVRLVNGETLPPSGFTVATPNPLYIRGNYNTEGLPASVASDALTVLSTKWNDNTSSKALFVRRAGATTVHTAILTGIVPTAGGYYSGGVENLIRLLEDWTDISLTYSGSFVVLFNSDIATAPWGASSDVYAPPLRAFSFDQNFLMLSKLPPNTPEIQTVIPKHKELVRANLSP